MVECGDGELVGVSGGGEEREVVRGSYLADLNYENWNIDIASPY